jgi:hypothetical protein
MGVIQTLLSMGGNQYTTKPTVTRKDPVRGFRIPALLLAAFQRAAKRQKLSLNRWLIGAGEERMAREKAEREGEP